MYQKLIYKRVMQNYCRLYSRSKNNVKNVRVLSPVLLNLKRLVKAV